MIDALQSLPFSERRQAALLGHLLKNDDQSNRFFGQAKDKVQPDWFVNYLSTEVWKAAQAFYKRHGRKATPDELKEAPDFRALDMGSKQKLWGWIDNCIRETANYGFDTLIPELTDWMHSRIYHRYVSQSTEFFNREKVGEAISCLRTASEEAAHVRFDNDHEVEFGNPLNLIEKEQLEASNACTWGLSVFDKLLYPSGNGSLLPCDTTLVLAPSNIGKTTALITVACANLRQLKSVLFITHEGRPEDIQLKIWCNLLGCTRESLFKMLGDSEAAQRMDRLLVMLRNRFTYIPYNKAGATVEEVEAIIRRRNEEWAATHGGKGYDLVVCDYPAKLTTRQAQHGNLAKRHVDDLVYGRFVQLALEYRFHSLLAIQTNREGSKVNRGRTEHGNREDNRLLTMEDAAESWGPITQATNVISINRNEAAKAKGLVTFYIDKSRSSETGYAVVCKSDYGKAITHSNEMGAVYYRGVTAVEKIDQLMEQYKDAQEIPMSEIVGQD
jgi:hypothetical protein